MWRQNYEFGGSLGLSALIALLPLVVLFYLLGIRRRPGWVAALSALATTFVVVLAIVRMPITLAVASAAYGAAFGLFPISWIVFASILLYRVAVHTKQFEIIKDSIGALGEDRRLQLLLIGFCFSAFIEGAAGFGSPVAVSAAMLAGLGFPPFYAAVLCLLGNTAPVAFGSIGIPIVTLTQITGLPMAHLSAMTGRVLAPIGMLIPIYLVVVMAGWRKALAVWPAILACGLTFALVQLGVSNKIGPELADILASIASIMALMAVMKVWHPAETFRLPGDHLVVHERRVHTTSQVLRAWIPYAFLVVFVLLWGYAPMKAWLDTTTSRLAVPALHNLVQRVPPVTAAASPYAAIFVFNWLSAAGTACVLAAIAAALALRVKPAEMASIYGATLKQLALPMVTISSVLAMAFLMNYAGLTSTLGLALAASGPAFPFFSATLGWLGVVLTGSVTSSNALFGNLQVVTAQTLGLSPILTAAVNASGGVMGKMLSLQSIAVAVVATGMATSDESKLFRTMLKHSVGLVVLVGVIAMVYAYLLPTWIP
ncbi:MAG: lactate permease LctP family transporter [Acidobacteriota bacterium]